MRINKPCLGCGNLTTNESRCDQCQPAHAALSRKGKRKTPEQRQRDSVKYNAAWSRLSKRARRMQTFCSDCGTAEDLTTDHTPEAWQRKAAGKPIRLCDVAVVCRPCNSKRGSAQPGSVRALADA